MMWIYRRRFGCVRRSYSSCYHRNSQQQRLQQCHIDRSCRITVIRSFSDTINNDRTRNTTATLRVIEFAASSHPKYNKKDHTNTDTSNDNNAIHYKSSTKCYPPLTNNDDDESNVNPRRINPSNDSWERCNSIDNTIDNNNPSTINNYYNYYYNRFHYQNVVKHFLPANYPDSVSSNYIPYASYCFIGSIAGSASMVLSTQTLLLAVVGGDAGVAVDMIITTSDDHAVTGSIDSMDAPSNTSNTSESTTSDTSNTSNHNTAMKAGIMAGALNWVLKDAIGQAGGIWYASFMGVGRQFDLHTKYYRMLAAMVLDVAALIEIVAPLLLQFSVWSISSSSSVIIVPLACCSTILKNIGFLSASASRAAIHQSFITKTIPTTTTTTNTTTTTTIVGSNLADVTAKSGSQSMAAGLMGTILGISLSSTLLYMNDNGNTIDIVQYLVSFIMLSSIHQVCNYRSLQYVSFNTFNYTRLYLLVQHYIQQQYHNDDIAANVLSPAQIGKMEPFVPFVSSLPENHNGPYHRNHPIVIGSALTTLCPHGSDQLRQLQQALTNISASNNNDDGNTSNGRETTDEKYILNIVPNESHPQIHLTFLRDATGPDLIKGLFHASYLQHELEQQQQHDDAVPHDPKFKHTDNETAVLARIRRTHERINAVFPIVFHQMNAAGWNTNTDVTYIEPTNAKRIMIIPSSS